MSDGRTLIAMFVAIGALLALLGAPLALRCVPRNRLYGLRVAATLKDDRVWYPANARTGADFIVLGALLAIVGAVLLLRHVSPHTHMVAGNLVLLSGLLVVTLRGILHARRLARQLALG